MQIARTIADCRRLRASMTRVALVPTMGALHAGHIALLREARKHAPNVAASIFVNPTQFGPKEDFTRYPRPIEQDLAICEEAGVSLVFQPEPEEMYGREPLPVVVDVPHLTEPLEGKHRPGHFRDVCQVVAKLLNIVQPDVALFGLKDYQQFRVIGAMTELLNFPVQIVGHPTVREPDGLAMSSRNQYLSADERRRALSISQALLAAAELVQQGVKQTSRLVATMQNMLLDPGDLGRVHVSIEYIAAVDPMTFKPVELVDRIVLLAIAARVGATRLIDNVTVSP